MRDILKEKDENRKDTECSIISLCIFCPYFHVPCIHPLPPHCLVYYSLFHFLSSSSLHQSASTTKACSDASQSGGSIRMKEKEDSDRKNKEKS
jgi:hypothetical protein